ncbi:MAG: hypothetical protein AAF327_05515 [Cyanobacteria bacterium P01_A01_bin.37]
MNVCVVGTGFTGLVTSVCLAHIGHKVICVDEDGARVSQLQSGMSLITEPSMESMMQKSIQAGRLSFTTELGAGMAHGDIIFVSVSNRLSSSDMGDRNTAKVVGRSMATHLARMPHTYKVIVNQLSSPVQSGNWLRQILLDEMSRPQIKQSSPQDFVIIVKNFSVVVNPVFLRKGFAINDMICPDQIILGSNSKRAISKMKDLYQPLIAHRGVKDEARVPVSFIVTDLMSVHLKEPAHLKQPETMWPIMQIV